MDDLGLDRVICLGVVAEEMNNAILQRGKDTPVPLNHRQAIVLLTFAGSLSILSCWWDCTTKCPRILTDVEQRGMHKPDRDECTTSSSQWPLVQPKHTPQSVHGVKIAFKAEDAQQSQQHDAVDQVMRVLIAWPESFWPRFRIQSICEGSDGDQVAKANEGDWMPPAGSHNSQDVFQDEPYGGQDINHPEDLADVCSCISSFPSTPILHGGHGSDECGGDHHHHGAGSQRAEEHRRSPIDVRMKILIQHVVDLLPHPRFWTAALLPRPSVKVVIFGREFPVRPDSFHETLPIGV
mmetsp:Transcript_95555/g.227627  ORF Transcript_95555/g.227627 Transcript_95555/m.227627 type:complete len:294 (+) Transcript_95555:1351-2232(+)